MIISCIGPWLHSIASYCKISVELLNVWLFLKQLVCLLVGTKEKKHNTGLYGSYVASLFDYILCIVVIITQLASYYYLFPNLDT